MDDDVLLLCWRDTGHPQGGGSERYLERIGAELAASGMRVTLRTARYPGAPKRELRDGMTISRGGGRLTVYPRALMAIVAGRLGFGPLAGRTPKVVVDTQNGVPFFARAVVAAPVVVLVHHCHQVQWPVAGALLGRVGWSIESRLSPRVHRSDQYVTVSLPSREDLVTLGIETDRIAVVRAGADPVPSVVATRDPRRLVVLSRLVPHKQIEDALEVVARLNDSSVRLDIVGGGWWEQQLRQRAEDLGLMDRVRFHGHVTEQRKHELLARAGVALLPSRTEGWGLAVIEAAQHGVPTIGYRSSRGLTDSIIDRKTGLLVESLSDMVTATKELIDHPEAAHELGDNAQRRAQWYSWPDAAQRFRSVLDAARQGRRVSGVVE